VASNILLDEPAANPALGCGDAAHALGQIIQHSEPPRFAVGIFGGWGSGKTTLMDAIKSNIKAATKLVPVEFNAWKYEREPQLLVPLLDTMRAALIGWAKDREPDRNGKVHASADRIGRVVRALATGLSAGVGLPGAATVTFDLGTALDGLSKPCKNPESAQSLYFAAFQELKEAFQEFRTGGITRVVVFVDDIDRCLPANALQVLESMKLFFDLEGFIFIVGLDPDVVGRAVQSKFFSSEDNSGVPATPSSTLANRLGREYIQKIFQVQYWLPPVYPEELEDLLGSMLGEGSRELTETVLPYLKHLTTDGRLNPREVKRLINDFTLDAIIKPKLRADTMLALRILQFPHEWAFLYSALLTDPIKFQTALKRYQREDHAAFADLMQLKYLPESAKNFLLSPEAIPLTGPSDLRPYLSSLKSVNSTTSWFYGAAQLFIAITTAIRQALDDHPRDPVAALRAAQATLPDSAADLGTFFSTAESKVPEEFQTLRRAMERVDLVSSSQEIDEDVARELLMNLLNKGALATLAAAPPH
jgi:KAP family P-loop domain